jgi:hypothetical protein
VRIDADIWTAPCVDADPVSCAHRIALAGEQETRVVHDTLQLGEHITRDKILAHHHDGINANNAAPANIDRTVFIVAIPALITVPNLPPPPFTAAQADFRLARAFR